MILSELEDYTIEARSKLRQKLSQMTEEDRRMLLMWPEEKEFFMEYKKKNPKNPWAYFKEYQKKIQQEYKARQEKLA